jgi:L-threonylcarbamoyladenylate synthase
MNIKTKILNPRKKKDILEAVSMIQNGQIIAVPTETVYGLAADARNVNAVEKIFIVKNRPSNHPLIVHIASFEKLSEWAKDIPPIASIIAQHFWPGPITLLLKKNDSINDVVTGGLKTIAVRIPKNKALLKILHLLNTGLAAPSANLYKRISPTSSQHVMSSLSGKIDAVLDGGPCHVGIESTILDLTENKIRILRHGPITKKMLEKVLKISIESPSAHLTKVPGNMKTHYQPYTKTLLMSLDQIKEHLSLPVHQEKLFGVIHYSDLGSVYSNTKTILFKKNKNEYARKIYQALHELDRIDAYQILVETPPQKESWRDVLDRLSKASSPYDKENTI